MAKVFGVAHWAHQPFLLSLVGLTPKPPKRRDVNGNSFGKGGIENH